MGDLGSTALFYASRPVIELDGRGELALAEGLLSLSVRETTDGLACCECTFGNWGSAAGGLDFLYFDRALIDFGKPLAITLGDGAAQAKVFAGRITAIEGRYPIQRSPEICVLAEDGLQDLRMTRRTRTFEEVSDEDVFRSIASDHGLSAEIDVDGPTHRVLAQLNQSDLAFVRERARAIDAEVWFEEGALRVASRARRSSEELHLTYGQGLREFSVGADLALQRTSLTVSGWDVSAKEAIEEEASESAIQPELDAGRSGSSLLERAFGVRVERMVHLAPRTSEEARAQAEANYRRMARGFVRGRGLAEGDGRLRVGAKVRLHELGPLFDGPYHVTAVEQVFEQEGGFRTRFEVERPGLEAS